MVGPFRGADLLAGEIAFLPGPAVENPLGGGMHQPTFIEGGRGSECLALDDAEVLEHLADVRRFQRRQRQIMRPSGEFQLAVRAACGIAEVLRPGHEQQVPHTVLGELPGSGEAGDAGTGDQHLGVDRLGGFGQRARGHAIAQAMAGRPPRILRGRGQVPAFPQRARAGGRQRRGRRNEIPAPHQRITRCQSSSK